ncbi:signal recognition particle-docking protein FtsY [Thiohalocapsa marina]|uniref:Signal recognition particle receptor FtsY n=1 Tax=Thiohalocapsa marina TaxID=424902 RepID=A0A5M8FRN7_9GAMM|nr:signal recognition particle-docking protein FtsY [Thiohalocapsa marina]KAA6185605.1 signal recognition particle-docking protein FtsY [Thiohalocapsa marina]
MFGFGKKKRTQVETPTEQATKAGIDQGDADAHAPRIVPAADRVVTRAPASAPSSGPEPSAAPVGIGTAEASARPPETRAAEPPVRIPARAPVQSSAAPSASAAAEQNGQANGRLAQAIAEHAARRTDEPERKRFLSGLRAGLARTREVLNADISELVTGRKEIDQDLLDELEMLLLSADVGIPATTRIIDDLSYRVKLREVSDPAGLLRAVRAQLAEILRRNDAPVRQPGRGKPQVILMVGVNGVGKTTSIGKLTKQLQAEGNTVMLAAGDTFRAAAVEQLQAWGERNQVPVVAQHAGADPASVIYDALQAATARGVDVLIADTAGRLHTKVNLMEELRKIGRVMKKIDPDAPHEVMLVVDATTGQNALHQAVQFNEILPLTGITVTKLDGTAKGGILFAIAERLPVPFRFIGVGERIEDLRHFDAEEFLDALLAP